MEKCYLCGKTSEVVKMTDDHVPPKGIFVPGTPNLIKVRCCEPCNGSYKLDDEAFRAWISTVKGNSQTKKWIFDNKVMPSFQTRNQKMLEHVRNNMNIGTLHIGDKIVHVPTISFPIARAERVLVRITKGLLTKFCPHYDYSRDAFLVQAVAPTPENLLAIKQITTTSIRDCRDEHAFMFWRAINSENFGGVWVYLFYDEACFRIIHSGYRQLKTRIIMAGGN